MTQRRYQTSDRHRSLFQGLNHLSSLIVQPRARRALAGLLRLRAPACLVLSIAELPVSQPIEVIAVIGGPQPPPAALPHPELQPAQSESLAA